MAKHNRRGAALKLQDLLGDGAPAEATLPALPIPYVLLNGRAIYDDADLTAYADKAKSRAVRRMGGRRRRAAFNDSAA